MLLLSDLFHPQPVQVAVFVHCHGFVAVCEDELCRGFVTGFKVLDLAALRGFEGDELYVVLVGHRVFDFADPDVYGGAVNGDGRNVLFEGAVRGAGDEFLHGLAAAYDRDAGVVKLRYDVSAVLASIEFHDRLLIIDPRLSLFVAFIFVL